MACKCLQQKLVKQPPELGGPITPQFYPETICVLDRGGTQIGWILKCEETPHDGPCWRWAKEIGADKPDLDFKRIK